MLLNAEREIALRHLEAGIEMGDLTTLKAAVSMAAALRMPPGRGYTLLEQGRALVATLEGREELLKKEREDRKRRLKKQEKEKKEQRRRDEAARVELERKKLADEKAREARQAQKRQERRAQRKAALVAEAAEAAKLEEAQAAQRAAAEAERAKIAKAKADERAAKIRMRPAPSFPTASWLEVKVTEPTPEEKRELRREAAGSAAYAFVEYGVEKPKEPKEVVVVHKYDPEASPVKRRAPLDPAVLRTGEGVEVLGKGPSDVGRTVSTIQKDAPLSPIVEEAEPNTLASVPGTNALDESSQIQPQEVGASEPTIVVAPPTTKLTGAQAAQAAAAAIKERLKKNKMRAQLQASGGPPPGAGEAAGGGSDGS